MLDLFQPRCAFEQVRLAEAEVFYLAHLPLAAPAETLMTQLIAEVPWRAEDVAVWGKTFRQPRLIAWYGDKGQTYTYSGINLEPLPWTEMLFDVKRRIEDAVGTDFNSVLLNYYRDNRDSMGFHSDDEPELGERPIIASLSLGDERTFVLRHKRNASIRPVRLRLGSGSLLLMKGTTQQNWKHGIPKETRRCGPRVNLTFRRILFAHPPDREHRG